MTVLSDAGLELESFTIVLQHFSAIRGHVDFARSAELTWQVEKSTPRAYQAPMPADLRH